MRTFLTLALVSLLTAFSASAQVSGQATRSASDLDAEEAVLRESTDVVGLLDLLLFLHAFRTASPARDAEINQLKNGLDNAAVRVADRYILIEETTPVPYDGTDESLLPTVRLLSSTHLAETHRAFYAIPCAVLVRRPGLLAATKPLFGGNLDNFLPRSGCAWDRGSFEGYPAEAVQSYLEITGLANGNFDIGDHMKQYMGSNRFSHAANQSFTTQMSMLDPGQLRIAPFRPYETWSYLSLSNRRAYAKIMIAYETALETVTDYWIGIGHSPDTAADFARRALFAVSIGAYCGDAPPPRSLRTLLIDGAPLSDIVAMAAEGAKPEDEAFVECARYAGIDPLILTAVERPDSLPVLFNAGFFPDIDVRNWFGKTALMVAAQIDNEASVNWLLQHGANVNATTDSWQGPSHGQRTALHYAVSEARLSLIRTLIDAYADTTAEDDEGASVIDYLNGDGPVEANSVLSATERAEVHRLLSTTP